MLNAAEKAEIRRMVLDMIDAFQEDDHWPAYEQPRMFAYACAAINHPLLPEREPTWGSCEIFPGVQSLYQKRGIAAVAHSWVGFLPPDLGGRPMILVEYEDGSGREILMVDTMVWHDRIPKPA